MDLQDRKPIFEQRVRRFRRIALPMIARVEDPTDFIDLWRIPGVKDHMPNQHLLTLARNGQGFGLLTAVLVHKLARCASLN